MNQHLGPGDLASQAFELNAQNEGRASPRERRDNFPHSRTAQSRQERRPIRLHGRNPSLLAIACEALALIAASLVAGIGYHEVFLHNMGPVHAFVAVGLTAAIIYSSSYSLSDRGRNVEVPLSPSAVISMALLWAGIILLLIFLAFSLEVMQELSRGMLFAYLPLGYLAILITRAKVLPFLARLQPLTLATARPLLLGAANDPATNEIVSALKEGGIRNFEVVEFPTGYSDERWNAEFPSMIAHVHKCVRSAAPEEICIMASAFSRPRLDQIASALSIIPRDVRVIPDQALEPWLRLPQRHIGPVLSLELQKAPMNAAQRLGKRVVDLSISVPLLILLLPVLTAIGIAIRLGSAGPALFRQRRLGYLGKPFCILKFRTMTVMEDGDQIQQTHRGDARVTRVGAWLRKASLDELPQLVNVIRGEMSLVGPRPHAIAHDRDFSRLIDNYEVRQHVKPGITGWAQVNGLRGEISSDDLIRKRIAFDLYYANNASLWFDFKILIMTIFVVLGGNNAY